MQAAQVQPSVREFVAAPLRKMLIDGQWVAAATANADPHLEELMEIYRRMAPAQRPAMLAILRAAVSALK